MKKLMTALICIALLCSLSACARQDNKGSDTTLPTDEPNVSDVTGNSSEVTTEATTTEATTTTTEATTTEVTTTEATATEVTTEELEIGGYAPIIKYGGKYYSCVDPFGDRYSVNYYSADPVEVILDSISATVSDILSELEVYEAFGAVELNHIRYSELAGAEDFDISDLSSTYGFHDEYEFYLTDAGLLMVYIYDESDFEMYTDFKIPVAHIWEEFLIDGEPWAPKS